MTPTPPAAIAPPNASLEAAAATHGLDLSPYAPTFLSKTLAQRRESLHLKTPHDYVRHVGEHREEAEALRCALHVNHSAFFRSPLAYAVLEQRVFPQLLTEREAAGGGEIRIWSAGCAAGQEPWSIAILLDELTANRNTRVSYRVFASDLCESALAEARTGVYGADALGNVRLRHLDACFARVGDAFTVVPRLRDKVEFAPYDLLDATTTAPPASIYGGFDVVLCCNLLFYYHPEAQRRILEKLCRALAPSGYLVTGETERELVKRTCGLRALLPPSSVFQNL